MVRAFPSAIRQEIGLEIRRLQQGTMPHDSRPMQSIGKGVFELRQRDGNGWYRLIYLTRVGDTLYMLHGFTKKSAKTSRNDLAIASNRLNAVRARLAEEKKNARKNK
ncbi:MAG: type II toxin-antitoxin system RelE/ParE family toxin [Pirellulales bacterium]